MGGFGSRLIAVMCIAAACSSAWAADGPAAPATAPATIALRNQMWQKLPEEISDVYVGPDGRPWYIAGGAAPASLDAFKRQVESAFTSPTPVIRGAWIALFEPGAGGRVWFASNELAKLSVDASVRGVLLGYDGKRWVVHETNAPLSADAPGRPTVDLWRSNNGYLAPRAFFVVAGEIHAFDGTQWSTQVLDERANPGRPGYVALLPESDGKGMLAYLPEADHAVWRWKEGRFAPAYAPGAAYGRPPAHLSPGPQGVWVENDSYLMRFDPSQEAVSLTQLVQMAISPLLDQRDAALRVFANGGSRLTNHLGSIARDRGWEGPVFAALMQELRKSRLPKESELGEHWISQAALTTDMAGRSFFFGREVLAGQTTPLAAIYMEDRDGMLLRISERQGEKVAYQFLPNRFAAVPVGGTDGREVWLSCTPPWMLDTKAGRISRVCAVDTLHYRMQAASPEALYFLAGHHVYAYRHDQKDGRVLLRPEAIVGEGMAHIVDRSGAVVASAQGTALLRWQDGKKEILPAPPGGEAVLAVHPGTEGTYLVQVSTGWFLVTPKETSTVMPLRELLERYRAEIGTAFLNRGLRAPDWISPGAGGIGGGASAWFPVIAVDAEKRIWIAEPAEQKVAVLTEAGWTDIGLELQALGVQLIHYAMPAGDGSRVYLRGQRSVRRAAGPGAGMDAGAVLAWLDEGGLRTMPAPGQVNPWMLAPCFRENEGTIWIPGDQGAGAEAPAEWSAISLTEKGPGTLLKGIMPVLRDSAGNLVGHGGITDPSLRVCRQGKITCEVGLPSLRPDSPIFEVAPGVIWIWTVEGIQELRRDAANPGIYRETACYNAQVERKGDVLLLPGKGLIISGKLDRRAQIWSVALVPFPAEVRGR